MHSPSAHRFDRTLFTAWPFVAFILPAAICWGFGDLEYYFLIHVSWIVIPLLGLISLIPYFLARRRGWRVVPGNSIGVLLLNWWSSITVACAIPGKLTGGGRASVLELLTLESMSLAWNERILISALIVGPVTWAVLVCTTATAGAVREPSRRQMRISLVAAVGAPCVVLIAAMLGGTFENARSDADDERPEHALARPLGEQLELLAEREEETQVSLSEVRQMIASDGWKGAHSWMFGSCEREANPCYDISVSAHVTQPDFDYQARTRLGSELEDAGWKSSGLPPYCHGREIESYRNDEGQRLCIKHDDETLSVSLISPPYWGDLFILRDAANPDAIIFNPKAWDRSATYRWNEWQTSDLSLR